MNEKRSQFSVMNDIVNDIMNDIVNDKHGHFAHKPYGLFVALLVELQFCLGYYVQHGLFTILFFRIIILALVLDNINK